MNSFRDNIKTIITNVLISVCSSLIILLLGRFAEWFIPVSFVTAFENSTGISFALAVMCAVFFVVICLLLIFFRGVNHTVLVKKALIDRKYRSITSTMTIKADNTVTVENEIECISRNIIKHFDFQYNWSGQESHVTTTAGAAPVRDVNQNLDGEKWHLEFSNPKPANKLFAVSYTIHGDHLVKPILTQKINFPTEVLKLKLKFEGAPQICKISKICRLGSSEITVANEQFSELENNIYEYSVTHPKLLHTYGIEWECTDINQST